LLSSFGVPMGKPHHGYLCFVILILGLSLGLPAQDISETSYDESEAAPYLGIRPFSIAEPPEAAARTTRRVLHSLQLTICATSRPVPASTNDNAAQRTIDARVSLARLSTLRC
jgi:hypothetical protein